MQVEAIYENGKLEFVQPLRLKHERVMLVVTVPDHEVELPAHAGVSEGVVQRARAMREKLDAIRNAPLPTDDQLPEPTLERLERITAFELREER